MIKYFFLRFIQLIPVFLGITLISFVVIHLAPGSPVDAKVEMNPKISSQAKEKLKELYGLDKPIPVQYANWLKGIVQLDLGYSYLDGEKVTTKIGNAFPVTFLISGLTLLIILSAGIPLGVWAAARKNEWPDHLISGASLFAFSLPSFWIALLLISLFGVRWHLLPVSGLESLFSEEWPWHERVWDTARHLVLPLIVSSFIGVASLSRYMRSSMIEALSQPYIRTARAKGLPESKVFYKHALKNALLPVITILGLSIPALLGGSVIVESIFSIPGMGRLFYNAVFSRDYPVIMGTLVFGACLTLVGNWLADICYSIADPRIRNENNR